MYVRDAFEKLRSSGAISTTMKIINFMAMYEGEAQAAKLCME